jgi:hypothetical protein
MKTFSTTQAARKLGIDPMTLSRYIKLKKVPAPKIFAVGESSLHAWSAEEIEHVRQLLPKIANGRKTRYKKKQSAISTQQSAVGKSKTEKEENLAVINHNLTGSARCL